MPVAESAMLAQQAIQLSVAPVFLLTGIAGLLGVMANRLARIIDRARHVEGAWYELDEKALALARAEVDALERRRHLANWAINLCTGAALLVCLVIVTLFVEEFVATNLKWMAGLLFVMTMVSVIAGLACFLGEVYIATHASRIDARRFARLRPMRARQGQR